MFYLKLLNTGLKTGQKLLFIDQKNTNPKLVCINIWSKLKSILIGISNQLIFGFSINKTLSYIISNKYIQPYYDKIKI